MEQIKSEKAKLFINQYQQDGFIHLAQAMEACAVAENELIEKYEKEIDFYLKELERCKSIFESIRDTSLKITTANVSHHKVHITGMASRMVDMITQKLTDHE